MRTRILVTEDHEHRLVRLGTPASYQDGLLVSNSETTISVRHKPRHPLQVYNSGVQPLWLAVKLSNGELRSLYPGLEVWAELSAGRSVVSDFVGVSQTHLHLNNRGLSVRLRRKFVTALWVAAVTRRNSPREPNISAQLRSIPFGVEILVRLYSTLAQYGMGESATPLVGIMIQYSDFEGTFWIDVPRVGELCIPMSHVAGLYARRATVSHLGSFLGAEGIVLSGTKIYRGPITQARRALSVQSTPPCVVGRKELWVSLPENGKYGA